MDRGAIEPLTYPSGEAGLIARSIAGDLRAYDTLFDRNAPSGWELALVCYRRPATAEIALRLALGKVIVNAHQPSTPETPFGLALYRQLRSLSARVEELSADADDEPISWARTRPGRSTSPNRLVEAFEALAEPERVALWLTEIQRLTLPELATVLDAHPDAAHGVLERARIDIKRRILRVPMLERPPHPAAALRELSLPMPPGLRHRASQDWQRWLARTR